MTGIRRSCPCNASSQAVVFSGEPAARSLRLAENHGMLSDEFLGLSGTLLLSIPLSNLPSNGIYKTFIS